MCPRLPASVTPVMKAARHFLYDDFHYYYSPSDKMMKSVAKLG